MEISKKANKCLKTSPFMPLYLVGFFKLCLYFALYISISVTDLGCK